MRLWLLRHPRPEVEPGVCYGRLDLAAQAQHSLEVCQRVAPLLPQNALLQSSPRRRCSVLAQALLSLRPDLRSSAPNTPEDARLAEMDFGTWEGQRWAEIHHAELQAWTDNFAHYRAGGGESVQEFMDRVGEALRQACIGTAEDGDMVWVSHAGVARAVSLLSQGITHLDAAHQWPQAGPDFGEFVIFDISAETQSALRV